MRIRISLILISPLLEPKKGEPIEPLPAVEEVEAQLDQPFKDIIGDDPSIPKSLELGLHQILLSRLKFWTEEGMAKENSEELLAKYRRQKFLEAPKMNPPIEAKLSSLAKKRDEYKRRAQNEIGSAITVIGSAASTLITETESIDPTDIFEKLYHSLQMLAEVYHNLSISRRATVTPAFSKSTKEILDKTKPDEYLFGSDPVTKIKNANAIEEITADMRQATQNTPSKTKNWFPRPGSRPGPNQAGLGFLSRPRLPFRKNNAKAIYTPKPQFHKNESQLNKPLNTRFKR